MKKQFVSFGIWLTALLILAVTILPHHHHDGGMPCMAMEVCTDDGQVNDHHTRHGQEAFYGLHASSLPTAGNAHVPSRLFAAHGTPLLHVFMLAAAAAFLLHLHAGSARHCFTAPNKLFLLEGVRRHRPRRGPPTPEF